MTNNSSPETTETLLNALDEGGTDEERRIYLRAIIRRLEADARKSASTLAKLASVLTLLALVMGCGGASEPVPGQDVTYSCIAQEDSCAGFLAELFTNCPENSPCLAAPVETERLCCTPADACPVSCNLVMNDAGTVLAVATPDESGRYCCAP
jgi:hypothetical protein